jgi:hypothetical protein
MGAAWPSGQYGLAGPNQWARRVSAPEPVGMPGTRVAARPWPVARTTRRGEVWWWSTDGDGQMRWARCMRHGSPTRPGVDGVASKRRRGDVPSLQRLSDGRRWPGQLM